MKERLIPKDGGDERRKTSFLSIFGLALICFMLFSGWPRENSAVDTDFETAIASCTHESCAECQYANRERRRLRRLLPNIRGCFGCCFPFETISQDADQHVVMPGFELSSVEDEAQHDDADGTISSEPGPSGVAANSAPSFGSTLVSQMRPNILKDPHEKPRRFPVTNRAITPISVESGMLGRLRRIETILPDHIKSGMEFIWCAAPYWGIKSELLPVYRLCYLNQELTHEETFPEYREAALSISQKYSGVLQTRFPVVLVQTNSGGERVSYWEPQKLGLTLDKLYDKNAKLGNSKLNWVAFSYAPGKGPPAYRFSVHFKKSIPRSVWMDTVFTFVATHPDIEWFKIAPFEPDGKDDAVFAIMQKFEPEEFVRKARTLCEFWDQPTIQDSLSNDLPPFQYNGLCKSRKVSWTTYHGGNSHGHVLDRAFSTDLRAVVSTNFHYDLGQYPHEYQPCLSTPPNTPLTTDVALRSCVILTVDTWLFCGRPVEDYWEYDAPLYGLEDFPKCVTSMIDTHIHLKRREKPRHNLLH